MFLNDQETAVDLLYYESIAKTVVRLIRETPEAPITIGVHGDWGAGKSSVLKMTQEAFADDKRTLCLWFNGWTFEGFEDAKTVVIETIVEDLRRARPTSAKVAEAARKVLKRVDWLKVAKKAGGFAFTAFTGVPTFDQISSLLDAGKALLAKPEVHLSLDDLKAFAAETKGVINKARDEGDHLPEQIHSFRSEFNELVEAADIDRLVVIVDDLDRCLPPTAVATLEAIRLFLFVPRTAFVIGADELMIEYAVREHFPDLPPSTGPVSYARNYLEKLIQVPFRVPALGATETSIYVTLLLAESALGATDERFLKLLGAAREDLRKPWIGRGLDRATVETALKGVIPSEIDQAIVISSQVTKILTEGTKGNPRQIKRFLNSLMLRYAIAEERGFAADIQRPALAKIMLAERFSSEFYEQLARLAATAANGRPETLQRLEEMVKAPKETSSEILSEKGEKKTVKCQPLPPETIEWAKSEWIMNWALLAPSLTDVDLRPYVFVTRDKRSYFGSSAVISHLEGLIERLMGSTMSVRASVEEVAKLGGLEPEQVFEEIRGRILQSDNFNRKPKGVDGLVVLVEKHPVLQRRLLGFIRQIPGAKAGAWAATSWGSCFSDAAIAAEFNELLSDWDKLDNVVLRAAIKGVMKIKES